tara:strand:- start:1230 stop:2477 length:1248 start_codon:yes stop_codon:yes gene_type:complete
MIHFEINLLLHEKSAYLTKHKRLDIRQLDIGKELQKRCFDAPAHLTIRILKHFPEERKINVEITSYNRGACELDNLSQENIDFLKSIEIINFNNINTTSFFSISRSGDPITIKSKQSGPVYYKGWQTAELQPSRIKVESIPIEIYKEFTIPFRKIAFNDGFVSFSWKYKELKKNIILEIFNEHIVKEFEAVKNYFSRVLKTKKIKVKAKFEIFEEDITCKEVNSPEIEQINSDIIEAVKDDYLWQQTRYRKTFDSDKVSYTFEEYFNNQTNELKPERLFESDVQLLDRIIKISNSKHYLQLTFLSKRHLSDTMKLRFIFNPFSCVFLIEGKEFSYFVWETLDTEEATYIWQSDKSGKRLKETFEKIESIINEIKLSGRNKYLTENQDIFQRIYHDYSDQRKGFLKWKRELESKLI